MANFEITKQEYLNFAEEHSEYNSFCSGIGSCDHCNKKLYSRRSKYLKAYVNLYKLSSGKECNSPKLIWICADTAKEWNLADFHQNKCTSGKMIDQCDCLLADFIRVAYDSDDYNENSTVKSFGDQIYPILKKILGKSCP